MSREDKKKTKTLLMEKNECSVCIGQMNKMTKKRVTCGSCDYSACRECYKQYLLHTNDNPHCMNCKKVWNNALLVEKFDKNFVTNVYKQHRENVLFDRERSKMAATQSHVEQLIIRKECDQNIKRMKSEMTRLKSSIRHEYYRMRKDNSNDKKQFIRKCMSENCQGFLSSQWKCGLCKHWSCPDCHEVLGLERYSEIDHECNADTLATAKLLDDDTKTCPTCSTGIFKIDGCDVMFCTECHTSFSWRTGKIITGQIHNPHYFEWLRNGGQTIERNPMDIICGRELDRYFIHHFLKKCNAANISTETYQLLIIRIRFINHTKDTDIPFFRISEGYEDNLDLRVKYMMNQLDDKSFKKTLQSREKRNEIKHEYCNVLGMFVNCQTEIYFKMEHVMDTVLLDAMHVQIDELVNESNRLMEYTNECLKNISHMYRLKHYYYFTDLFEMKHDNQW
jgi:hypothetical protein